MADGQKATGDTDPVILVDADDVQIGTAGKLDAHQRGLRHRAISVLVKNGSGEFLLQQRNPAKYHSGGLWTNTCCSHPQRDLTLLESARVRLRQELGFETELHEAFSFVYRAADPASGLTEHEFDHVVFGRFDGEPVPNPDEVSAWRWVEPRALRDDISAHPERYTPWFKIVLDRVLSTVA